MGAPAQVKERLEYELDIIEKLGFSDYFLIVADLVQFARALVFQLVQGGGAGSLVAMFWALLKWIPGLGTGL